MKRGAKRVKEATKISNTARFMGMLEVHGPHKGMDSLKIYDKMFVNCGYWGKGAMV